MIWKVLLIAMLVAIVLALIVAILATVTLDMGRYFEGRNVGLWAGADEAGGKTMTRRFVALALLLVPLLIGCGKHYWQSRDRGVTEFGTDSGQCIQEATTKYDVSERIYRRCMRAHGWERVQTNYPSDRQFRGPEDEDEFFSPPNPLSERGPNPAGRPNDPACAGPTASRPQHCPR